MNVFDIAAEYRNLESLIDSEAEVPEEELLQRWLSVESDLNAKVENIGFAIRNREAILAGKHEAIIAMESSAQAVEKEIDRLKKLAIGLMTATGLKKAGGNTLTLSVVPNAPTVEIENEAEIPFGYLRVIEPIPAWYAPDKKALAEDLKAGVIVAGARLKKSVRLNIK